MSNRFVAPMYAVFCFYIAGIINVSAADGITIKNAWSPEAPPVSKVMAGFMQIFNSGNKDLKIKSINSDFFKKVEIHLTKKKNNMYTMVKQDDLILPAGGQLEFKSGGLHFMLMDKIKPISKGMFIPIILTFENGIKVKFKLEVKNDHTPSQHNH